MKGYHLLEWQFYPRWAWPWRHVEFDPDYGTNIVWFGFAFWQFRAAQEGK